MAVALSGAIIVERKGTGLKYKNKCENCGDVSSSTINTQLSASTSVKKSTSFKCHKCGNMQKVLIQGGS